jgi:hypothetical protein
MLSAWPHTREKRHSIELGCTPFAGTIHPQPVVQEIKRSKCGLEDPSVRTRLIPTLGGLIGCRAQLNLSKLFLLYRAQVKCQLQNRRSRTLYL